MYTRTPAHSNTSKKRAQKKAQRKSDFYMGKTPPSSPEARTLFIIYRVASKFLSICTASIFSFILILILTGTIVGTVVTVYILSFTNLDSNIELKKAKQMFSTYVYTMNSDTNEYELAYKSTPKDHNICIAADISKLPDHVKYAFVSIEDERFYVHDGVDYKRTGAAIANLALSQLQPDREKFGGSTITQQLIKNITGDNKNSLERKMREIFTAMEFEKKYTKDEILEAYLSEIFFDQIDGYNMYGIEAAAIGYFGKSASDLTIAEAACLAAIPKNPYLFNPTEHYEENKERKNIVLCKMFELGVITADQYESAVTQRVIVKGMPEFDELYPDCKEFSEADEDYVNPDISSYAVDLGIMEFMDYLSEENNLKSSKEALDMFNNGGYTLYLTVDDKLQKHLEETYSDWFWYFPQQTDQYDKPIQSSCVVMDYQGHILGTMGRIGPKEPGIVWNNAYNAQRQCGSTIKPVTTYGYAVENNFITWSTMFNDTALPAGVADTDEWPQNYDGDPTNETHPVNYFLRRSINTLPAQICNMYSLESIFGFATKKLHLQLDPENDMTYSALAVGGTANGPTMINLTNAYMPYGNGGKYYKASIIGKAVDTNTGEIIIDNENREGEQVVSEETAYVMNKLLHEVVNGTNGTGADARLSNKETVGKTGTTEEWRDITFVGLTPDFLSGIWVGYEEGLNSEALRSASSAGIWRQVFGTYANAYESDAAFPECSSVVYKRYCSETGLVANDTCPGNEYGYYKSTNCECCNVHKSTEQLEKEQKLAQLKKRRSASTTSKPQTTTTSKPQ